MFDWPWIYALVAASALLDVFLPVLPSGVIVISATTVGATGATGATDDVLDVVALLLCAAAASCLGDMAAYRLARRGGDWLDRRMAQSRRPSTTQERLGAVLTHGGGVLVVNYGVFDVDGATPILNHP